MFYFYFENCEATCIDLILNVQQALFHLYAGREYRNEVEICQPD